MTMRTLKLLIPIIALFFGACQNNQPIEKTETLAELEKAVFSTPTLDTALGKKLLRAYRKDMESGLKPEILFKAGEVAYNMPDREDEAMEYFQRLSIKFPKHEKAPHAVFYKGLIYENRWSDREMGAKAWEEFLVKYPTHELAHDAAELLTLARDTVDDLDKVKMWLEQEQQ
jgi:outer membrane protein assembly factor BamD (BamD/ComL family)